MLSRPWMIWCLWPVVMLPLILEKGPDPGKGSSSSPPLMVLFSTEQNGYLTPCGCSKPMLGGLPRRAGFIRSLAPRAKLLKVDNGDLTQAAGRQDELKAETLIEMLNDLDYDAINLGENDFRLGVAYLQALRNRFRGVFLCANVLQTNGSPIFKEYTVVKRDLSGKSVSIVLAGLLSRQFQEKVLSANPEVRLESPSITLARLQQAIASSGEIRLLLYHGPEAEAEQLARRFPVFHLILCAHEGDSPAEIKQVGSAQLACNGEDGKYIGQARLTLTDTWRIADIGYVPLGPDLPEDPRLLALKRAYLERVTQEDLLGQVVKSPAANGDTLAGTAACGSCHPEAHQLWKGTAHAKAMQTLVNEQHDKDPECVTCHVVGLEEVSGFTNHEKTPHLENVGCESCHGAAARHAKDPKTPMPKAGDSSCRQCHIPQHSPNFESAKYWEKIKH